MGENSRLGWLGFGHHQHHLLGRRRRRELAGDGLDWRTLMSSANRDGGDRGPSWGGGGLSFAAVTLRFEAAGTPERGEGQII
jgi:hypothetical protein